MQTDYDLVASAYGSFNARESTPFSGQCTKMWTDRMEWRVVGSTAIVESANTGSAMEFA
jgi:hypothetical protein